MINNLPKEIPIFPLDGVIFFPKTNLPLNIFEQRYLDLVNDCLKKDKLMGMIQSKNNDEIYSVGCLGKINDYEKTSDGRILLNLNGLVRFNIKNEIKNSKKYREFEVDYTKFSLDMQSKENLMSQDELSNFIQKTKRFFNKNGIMLNWNEFKKLDQTQQINTLSMIAPVSNGEKQKLLESVTQQEKTKALLDIVEFYLYDSSGEKITLQ
ncbi:MAG: hypothetical protein CBD76_01710 [Pelagibacteraceae bacterium TMED216]|nr:MAG: hypothetical protein CBD76_01710 [Pelagibacteraceae bacterium TMED216]|tara:strand:+ start:5421 stop:6047 length:627 start_codon:yes stop_codon:yes gene_type:complete